jgi:prephenate dehydratase
MNHKILAFQGEKGAYSEDAGVKFFNGKITTKPCRSFEDVFLAVKKKTAYYGIIPIENTLAGSLYTNYDLLLKYNLKIAGEINYKVTHSLIALPGVKLSEIKKIYSHPSALMQCEKFLSSLKKTEKIEFYDTAGSVLYIKSKQLKDSAAVASGFSAKIYKMKVLAKSIEDQHENYTRFLILSQEGNSYTKGNVKTSIVFSLPNEPGILFKSLSVFALRNINLTKIESRPLKSKPFEYYFYADFIGGEKDEKCRQAINHLKEIAVYIKILGTYPVSK